MQKPTTVHWQAARGSLRFVASTKEHCIVYGKDPGTLIRYCDADYAGDLDTRRSTTGYVFILHEEAITWLSKCQPTVAAYTTEARTSQRRRSTRHFGCGLCWTALRS